MFAANFMAVAFLLLLVPLVYVAWREAQGRGGIRGAGWVWSREDLSVRQSDAIGPIIAPVTRTIGAGGGAYTVTLAPTNEPGHVDVQVRLPVLGFATKANAILIEGKYVGLDEGRKLIHWMTVLQFVPLAVLSFVGIWLAVAAWSEGETTVVATGIVLAGVAIFLLWLSARQRAAFVCSALQAFAGYNQE